MRTKFVLLWLLLAPVLAACSNTNSASGRYVSFVGDTVVVKVPGKPVAHINAHGDLRIGNITVAVDPSQRVLLQRYHSKVLALRDDGIATAKQGAALGMHAIGTVASNLVAGTPDKIDHQINTGDKSGEITAQRLCDDLEQLKTTQNEVAARLPAFGPYAVFGNGMNYFGGNMQCDDADHPQQPLPPLPPKAPSPPSSSGAAS